MKKNLIKMMLVAVVVIASGVNIYNSQKKSGISKGLKTMSQRHR